MSERIIFLLESTGSKQKDLCNHLGVAASTLNNWLKLGRSIPSEYAIPICEFFQADLKWLLTGENENLTETTDNLEKYLLETFRELPQEHKKKLVTTTAVALTTINDNALYKEVLQTTKRKSTPATPPKEPHTEKTYIDIYIYDEPAAAGLGNYIETGDHETIKVDESTIPHRADCLIKISGDSMEPHYPNGCIVWVQEMHQIPNDQVGIFSLNGEALCKKIKIDYENRKITLLSLNNKYKPIEVKNGCEDNEGDDFRTFGKVIDIYKNP